MTVADTISGLSAGRVDPVSQTGKLSGVIVLYLLMVVIPIGVSLGPLALTGVRLVLMIMIVPLMVRLFMGHYGRVLATDVLFVLHIGWMVVALIANNPSQVIEQTGSVGMEFLGGYVVGRAYIRTRADFIALTRLLIVVVLCMTPLAVVEATTGVVPLVELMKKLPGVRTVAISYQDHRFGLRRVQLGFVHPIHFGLFCSVAFSLCFVGMAGTFTTTRRWIISAIITATCLLALSSGAFLAIAAQIGMIFWAKTFEGFQRRWWILLGLFAVGYVVVDLLSNRTPIAVFMSYATFSAHTAYWRALIFEYGMQNVWANPIFGLGLNDWARPYWMPTSTVDNFWLLMAMRYGFLGFLTVTLGYILVVYHVMRIDVGRDAQLTMLRRAWVFTFLGLSFTLCTVHVWTSIYSFVFFLLGAGVWFITAQPQTEGDDLTTPQTTPLRSDGSVFARSFADDQTQRIPVEPQPAAAHEQHHSNAPQYSRFHRGKPRHSVD